MLNDVDDVLTELDASSNYDDMLEVVDGDWNKLAPAGKLLLNIGTVDVVVVA